MPDKRSRRTRIAGNVNVTHGDVVAGDKTVVHGNAPDLNAADLISHSKESGGRQNREGSLQVTRGDVVFGDKIIRFFQDNLNIYLFKDIKQLAFALAVVILLLAGVATGFWYSRQPRRMTGNFNIAVAQFGETAADGSIQPSKDAETIGSKLIEVLDTEIRASRLGIDVETAHKNMPLVIEERDAEALAARVNADIVIYGRLDDISGEQAEFTPRFYVVGRSDTDELTGSQELGNPIPFSAVALGSDNEIHAQLRARTETLFNFTKALIYYSRDDYEAASDCIDVAMDAANKLPQALPGEEALYLLAAKIEIARHDTDAANHNLDQALLINPKYARAHLARGNILYAQAVESDFDADLLDEALLEFRLAYEARDQPEGAYIPIKARTSLGNVLVVRAQQTNDPDLFSQAIVHYTFVVREYDKTQDPYLRSFAAVAYFGLGAAYERQGDLGKAVESYRHAADLTDDKEFRDRIEKQINAAQAG